jgi:acyl-CoA thioesterase
MSQFDADIAVKKEAPGIYGTDILDNWNVQIGPNGGYIAAILLNGMQTGLGDSSRSARSITFHFLSASTPGPARLEISIEKVGRTFATVSGKLFQGDRTVAIALATFAPPRPNTAFCDFTMPQVPSPEEIPEHLWMSSDMPGHSPFRDHYDQRLAIGPTPPFKTGLARVGGWTRLRELRPFDALSLTAISDSWYPSLFARDLPPLSAPTIDHTVHFFCDSPCTETNIDSYVLVEFETRLVQSGFLQADGKIWAPNGRLLAQSRQLALMMLED